MTDVGGPNFSQRSLEYIEKIDDILQELGKWLQKAKFEDGKKERTENCADPGMPHAAAQLLDALGYKKVSSLNLMGCNRLD
jgi:hypothetical protein